MIEAILSIFGHGALNVQLSDKAIKLLQDKKLASKVVEQVIIEHKKLDKGDSISVNVDSNEKVLTVTTTQSTINEKTY